MSHDLSAFKFRGVGVIVPQIVLDRHKKKELLLDIVGIQEELVTILREISAAICIVVKDLAFSLI